MLYNQLLIKLFCNLCTNYCPVRHKSVKFAVQFDRLPNSHFMGPIFNLQYMRRQTQSNLRKKIIFCQFYQVFLPVNSNCHKLQLSPYLYPAVPPAPLQGTPLVLIGVYINEILTSFLKTALLSIKFAYKNIYVLKTFSY